MKLSQPKTKRGQAPFRDGRGKGAWPLLRLQLRAALREDVGKGDITSQLLIPPKARGRAVISAREKGIFCGTAVIREIFRLADPKLRARFLVKEGQPFSKNKTVIALEGRIHSLLKAERTTLNFLGHLSGIATETHRFVERVKKYHVKIFDTRKTLPLWRGLQKYAVTVGGGQNHRFGLYDEIFVKENHRAAGDLKKLKNFPRKFVIEVRNLRELEEVLLLKPRVILFDNFSPAALRRAVRLARKSDPRAILEASGGVTLKNIAKFAAAGVDQISVGSLTHSVRTIDFSLQIQ